MDNKENENASVPENNTGKSSKKLSKKENIIYLGIMFGVIAPLLLLAEHYYHDFIEFISEHINNFINDIIRKMDNTGLGPS